MVSRALLPPPPCVSPRQMDIHGCEAAATSAPGGLSYINYLEQLFYPNSLAERDLVQSSSFQACKSLSILFNFLACWEMASVLSPLTVFGRKCDSGRSNTTDLMAGSSCYRQRLTVRSCKVFTLVINLI